MSNDNSEMLKGISFLKLIEKNKILVPKIQRDYAQGRIDPKASEIRDSFLSSIFDTLTTNNSDPLLLDFIYGSTHNTVFTPLDGQQRLTTLFLLHWYFIPQNKKSLLFIADGNSCYSRFSYETRISSKDFCNALVAQSAIELKKELDNYKDVLRKQIVEAEGKLVEIENKNPITNSDIEEKKNIISQISQLKNEKKLTSLSATIKNQSWFLWSWRKDPTVKAIFVMLDEINSRAQHLDFVKYCEIWGQLESSKIVFDLLPLEQFALTDELYVKMNARGKELSQFDIFKSTLEEQMRLNNVSDDIQNEWRENVDSNWIDVFWNKLAKPHLTDATKADQAVAYVDSVEKGYLRFFKRMMVFHLFLKDNCIAIDFKDEVENNSNENIVKYKNIKQYIPFDVDENNFLDKIRDFSVRKDNDILMLMPLFNKTKFFNEDFFKLIIVFFTTFVYQLENVKHDGTELIAGVGFESKKNLFESFIADSIEYETRVQFFALLKFFEFNSAQNVSKIIDLKQEFNSWMRIIRNLSTKTNSNFYNKYDDFLKSLKSIEVWTNSVYSSEVSGNIIDYFKRQNTLDGFYGEQLKEEKVKADLMSSNDWKETIREVEEHPYFLGQIRFVLEWSREDNSFSIEKFKKYYEKLCSVFNDNGLKDELCVSHIFRNALLSRSNYLIGGCFIKNDSKDRDWSWKRYLRTENSFKIKELLDSWEETNSFSEYCQIEIKKTIVTDWRKYFINKPEMYSYLLHNMISWWNIPNEEYCMLSKTKWSSKHTELRIYYWSLIFKGVLNKESYNYGDTVSVKVNTKLGDKFFVEYVPVWKNDKWQNGYYLLKCENNISEIEGLIQNEASTTWEKKFEISENNKLENLISQLC